MSSPKFVLVIPTLCAKNLIFRFLNFFSCSHPFRIYIDDSPSRSVAEKWNRGLSIACDFDIPAVIVNDDIIVWPGCIDSLLECDELFVNGITTKNVPSKEDPIELTRGGFSLFMIRPELIRKLEDSESKWDNAIPDKDNNWPSFKPGYFDEEFYPAYFEDQDFFYRIKLIDVKEHVCENAFFYHELIVREGKTLIGATTSISDHDKFKSHKKLLEKMGQRYTDKWCGAPGKERTRIPFLAPGN